MERKRVYIHVYLHIVIEELFKRRVLANIAPFESTREKLYKMK